MSDDPKVLSFGAAVKAKAAAEDASPEPALADPPKAPARAEPITAREYFDNMMLQTSEGTGPFAMTVDTRVAGVNVPDEFDGIPYVVLKWSTQYRYTTFEVDASVGGGIRADLSFGDEQKLVYIPWLAVRQLESVIPKVEVVCAAGWAVRTVLTQGDEGGFMRAYSSLDGLLAPAAGLDFKIPVSVRMLHEWGLAEKWAKWANMDLSLYVEPGRSLIEPKANNVIHLSLEKLRQISLIVLEDSE